MACQQQTWTYGTDMDVRQGEHVSIVGLARQPRGKCLSMLLHGAAARQRQVAAGGGRWRQVHSCSRDCRHSAHAVEEVVRVLLFVHRSRAQDAVHASPRSQR